VLPDALFANPAWHALQTKHRHLALSNGAACRYPADVAPLAALAEPTPAAFQQLRELLAPGESIWIYGENFPAAPQFSFGRTLECLQMFIPREAPQPEPMPGVVDLTPAHADEMVALTDIAFPGFYRRRTYAMGVYHGVRVNGELAAMAGERLMLEGYPEISGVCTHPAHRGRGYAPGLIWHLVRAHRLQGLQSWLHVVVANPALALYERMGFRIARQITLTSISRVDAVSGAPD
jgi:ribosomal protein S18 acetylase RimI-like enzyme